jgi:mannosyltransferase
MPNKINLHFDDIIYRLQGKGGISTYWTELSSMISASQGFQIHHTVGRKITRYLPVHTNAQIFHSSYYRIPLGKNVKTVVTIYDFLYEYGYLPTLNASINIWQMKLAINRADAIICISENTKKDLLSLYPNLINHRHIYAVGLGANLKIDESLNINPPDRLLDVDKSTRNRYILFVGKRVKYKNFHSAIIAFSKSSLPKLGFSMICVGSNFSDTENQLFEKLGVQSNVLALENITNKELNYLYQNAFSLVYPSLYEGFGLPPLEAMNCGCPVIASNTSSIPEVVGDAGILVNPEDTEAIASALEVLLDDNLRRKYISQGLARAMLFTWENTAQKHIAIYQSLVDNSK